MLGDRKPIFPGAPHNSLRDKSRRRLIPSPEMKALGRSWLLIVFLSGWLPEPIAAQTVIPDTEAARHVGQKATVEGVVVAVFTSKKSTFIDLGGEYPHETFTGWIPKDSPLAGNVSLEALEGKKVRITGTIDLYKGKPEIKIMSKSQIEEE
jgi:DNA/RNA endonuclease YhcR with UshA esterase domain